ncbi:MAG: TatD family hydrolase [Muribaculaceae bacterium]|nr:TatD family hydrolase [Muribaculaceae bacterium]
MIIDCHTHHPAPDAKAVISTSPVGFRPSEGQAWSVGLHPWDLDLFCDSSFRIKEEIWSELVMAAAAPGVVAIGECGIDMVRGGLLAAQMLAFRKQALLAERLRKPLVIHSVKAHDIIVGLKRDINPQMPWVIHGFRYKPSIAEMYLKEGCYLSFGEKFNTDSLLITPHDKLLAETDESALPIEEIISRLESASGRPLREQIIDNSKIFRINNI